MVKKLENFQIFIDKQKTKDLKQPLELKDF